jgi:DNA-binding LacI/PurR family transcriptional regulator
MRGVSAALAAVPDAELLKPLVPVRGYTWTDGAAAVDVYLTRAPLPDALVCFNDELAIAAMRRVHELGCRVPGEIAVVGIDGIKETEFVTPTLTTVAPDKAALADSAIASLVRRLGKEDPPPVQDVVVPHRLIVRESTADTSAD